MKGHQHFERHARQQPLLCMAEGAAKHMFSCENWSRITLCNFNSSLRPCHRIGDEESHRRPNKRAGFGSHSPA